MALIPELYTDQLEASKRFYCRALGFTTAQRLEGYYRLRRSHSCQLMLCQAHSRFVQRLFHPAYRGQGLILHLDSSDIEQDYARVTAFDAGCIRLDLQAEDVNGRHFTVSDPDGLLIDIVQGGDL